MPSINDDRAKITRDLNKLRSQDWIDQFREIDS